MLRGPASRDDREHDLYTAPRMRRIPGHDSSPGWLVLWPPLVRPSAGLISRPQDSSTAGSGRLKVSIKSKSINSAACFARQLPGFGVEFLQGHWHRRQNRRMHKEFNSRVRAEGTGRPVLFKSLKVRRAYVQRLQAFVPEHFTRRRADLTGSCCALHLSKRSPRWWL